MWRRPSSRRACWVRSAYCRTTPRCSPSWRRASCATGATARRYSAWPSAANSPQVYENKATVLADTAERAEEIDVDRARRSLEEARLALGDGDATTGDRHQREQLAATRERALNRLRVAGKPA